MKNSPRHKLLRFRRDENGSVTVEFVLWLPLIMAFLVFATDVSLAFMRQSQIWQVSRETARIVARYGMDEATAETFAREMGTMGATAPDVDVVIGMTEVTVNMSLPSRALTPFNSLGLLVGETVSARVTHTMEPIS